MRKSYEIHTYLRTGIWGTTRVSKAAWDYLRHEELARLESYWARGLRPSMVDIFVTR